MFVLVRYIDHFQYELTRSKYQKCRRSEKRKKKTKQNKGGYRNELSSLSRRKKIRDLWSSSGRIC